MKLLTNENNTQALKVVIASKVADKCVEVHVEPLEKLQLKGTKTVPQLVLDSEVHIFSSNAATKFLLSPTDKNSCQLVNLYLDLEAVVIQPLLSVFTGKDTEKIKLKLQDPLKELNQNLSSKQFLTGDNISACDISIWCTLYPLLKDSSYSKDLISNKENLKKWFDRINQLQAVQDALKSYPVKESVSSIASSSSYQSCKISVSGAVLEHSSLSSSVEKSAKEPVAIATENERKAAAAAFNEKLKGSSRSQVHPILPLPGEKNILITAALPYVNNVPHLGNIIGCVLSGDVFARYCRLRGYNTIYICGTDEYGTATETKAVEEKLTPKEICDKYFKIHDEIYKWFNIKFDQFGRTTTPQQTEICQDIFKKVYENGYVLDDSVEQLLCEKCDRYLADRFVEGTCPRCAFDDARGDQCDGCGHLINAPELIKPRCKICRETPVLRQSKQFFLDLPKVEPLLKEFLEKSWSNWSHNAREISKAWLSEGLKPRCITRDLKWGIPVPIEGFQNKVFYVWFDAPIGYISITSLYTNEWRKWWIPEKDTQVNLYQFMAKDNVPFHSVMFPASLIAAKNNYVTVSRIFATEYLNYEDGKFSKSRGIGVFGNDAQHTGIPADVWRFYLLYVRPESQDSSFSWADLALKNNSELLSTLGNFINRALMFSENNYNGKVPNINLTDEDCNLIALVNRELSGYISVLEKGKLREGIRHLLSIARLGNQFMQASTPWLLCKGTDEEKKRCETVIGLGINLACLLAQLLDPYMPETANTIRKQLNSPSELNFIDEKFRLLLPSGHQMGKPFPLFTKIEENQIAELKAKFSGRQKSASPNSKGDSKTISASESDVATLEAAVAAQGDVVRKLKAAGKDKTVWGPEVTILLDLKKKLAEAQNNSVKLTAPETNKCVPEKRIEEMEEKVKKQGDLVRKLKESGADKSQWQADVNILLELKKELAELKGEPLPTSTGKKNKKK